MKTSKPSLETETKKAGTKGVSPWVSRHAARHAEENKKRLSEPAPPGSARSTLRAPKNADHIKNRVLDLYQKTQTISQMRKQLNQNFFDIGEMLVKIKDEQLYQVKGFSTFESCLEREIDMNKQTALSLVQMVATFQKDAAVRYGLDRLLYALSTLETSIDLTSTKSFQSQKMIPTKVPQMRVTI